MAIKTPIKATFTGSDVTGLAEFQSGDNIGVAYGGTGANTLTGVVIGNGVSALTTVTDGTNGQVLTTNGAGSYSFETPASSISLLTDVNLTSLADGEILKYDAVSGQWVNAADAGGIALTDLSASDGITYNNSTGAFSLTDTGVTANTYGSSSQVPVITVNANGQITSATTAAVAGVSSTSFNTSTGVLTINTSDGSSYTEDLGIGTADSPQFTGLTVTNTITGTVSSLSNHDTDDLSEGITNLYYTDARFDTRLATKTTDNLSEGATNLYYTNARFDTQLATKTTDNLSEGTNLYYTDARADARVNLQTGANLDLSSKSTTDLSEGTNLYYTNARADARVNLQTGSNLDLSSKSTTDIVEGTNLYYTDARADARVNLQTGANLDLSSKTTDDLTQGSTNLYYADSLVDAHLSGGTGVTYSSGTISIGQDVGTTSNVEFNNLIVQGDLTVNGTTTTINATELAIEDNMIYLNDGSTTTNPDLGWAGNYNDGTYAHAGIFRDATDGVFKFYDGYTPEPGQAIDIAHASFNLADVQAGSFTGNLTGNVTGTVSSLSNHNTANLVEGTNLYYTDARADARVNLQTGSNLDLSSKSTTDLTEGTNLYYTNARADSRVNLQTGTNLDLSNKTSDDLTEGSTNLYYTDARFDTRLASKTTTNLTEGTNLYYTDARFDTRLATKTTTNLTEGTNLYYTDARADARVNLQTGSNLDLSSKTTTNLTEGTNLYYTDARVDTHLNTSTATANDMLVWNGSDYAWSAPAAQNALVSSNTTYTVTLEDTGDFTLQNSGALANKEAVLTTTTANQTVDTFPFETYRTAKYIFQATAGSDVHATELLIIHDGTTVYTTEYATIFSGSSLMTLGASISGSNVVVTATPANADTTIDFVRVSLIRRQLGGLEGDLSTQSGTEDLGSGSGTEDLNA